jgi:hypothetical protein
MQIVKKQMIKENHANYCMKVISVIRFVLSYF